MLKSQEEMKRGATKKHRFPTDSFTWTTKVQHN